MGPRRSLANSAEGASNFDLWSKEIRFFPTPEVVPDLHYDLQSFCRPLGEIVKSSVVLVTLHRVKLGEFLSHGWAHSLLDKQAEESDHMGPTIRRYLEDGDAKILKNLDKERVQRKPHPELKVTLGQRHMTD